MCFVSFGGEQLAGFEKRNEFASNKGKSAPCIGLRAKYSENCENDETKRKSTFEFGPRAEIGGMKRKSVRLLIYQYLGHGNVRWCAK